MLALTPEVEGVLPGLEALGRTYEALDERPLAMILDLKNGPTRTATQDSRYTLNLERSADW